MRTRWIVLGGVVLVAVAAAIFFLRPVQGPSRDLTLTADAEHGAYMIRLGGCVSCHTDVKGGKAPLSGGAALKTPFGSFYPPNITPDPEDGIGKWTLADFSKAMSNGHGPATLEHLYPAFPYDSYTLMSDQDLVDLFAGLRDIEPVQGKMPPHELGFPFNIRFALQFWKALFFHPHRYQPDPAQSDAWNRGKYLAYGPAHCVACHTPRNAFGAREDGRALQGSSGTPGGKVPSITKARLEEDGYDEAALIDTLKSGFTPGFDMLGGPMGEVVADSTSHWSDEDLTAIATYLLSDAH